MTVDQIKIEMSKIKEIKKTDVNDARERWKALKERIEAYSRVHRLPDIWVKILLDEIQKV